MLTKAIGLGILAGTLVASAASAQNVFATGSAVGGQNRYFSINVQTGVATALSEPPVAVQPTTTVGLAFTPAGEPRGIAGGQLVLPDFPTNLFANVGPLGPNLSAASLEILPDGRAFTYQTNEFSALLEVNLHTGVATPIGGAYALMDEIVFAGGALTLDLQPIIIGMGAVGDTLYAVESRTNTLVAIHPDTGVVTVPSGMAGQRSRGTLANGHARNRYATFAGVTGYDSNNDGVYDRLLGTVNTLDGARFGGLVEFNINDGSWELIGAGNAPLNFFSLGAPLGSPCPADYDGNDLVEVLDIFAFLTDWFAGVPAAYEFGGTPGVPAIFAFLTAWFAGCD